MRFVSFEVPSIMGSQVRVGALDAAGRIVDLAAALRCQLLDEGLTPEAALRVSSALMPADMVGGDRRRRARARRRPRSPRLGLASAAGRRGRDGVAQAAAGVRMLAPIPGRRCSGLHGLRAAPAQHLPEARTRDPAGVVQPARLLQGQPRQRRHARRRRARSRRTAARRWTSSSSWPL